MTAPIEDVSSLPGKKLSDQEENPIGEVKDVYTTEDGFPMWVSVELSQSMSKKRTAFIPLARIKDEDGELRVPYSKDKIAESPEIDDSDGISEECDFELRGYYGIGVGDQEMWSDNKGYATLVTEESAAAEKADADDIETPDADKRTEESRERLEDPGSAEMRNVNAEDVAEGKEDEIGDDSKDDDSDQDEDDDRDEDHDGEAEAEKDREDEPEGKSDSETEGKESDSEPESKTSDSESEGEKSESKSEKEDDDGDKDGD